MGVSSGAFNQVHPVYNSNTLRIRDTYSTMSEYKYIVYLDVKGIHDGTLIKVGKFVYLPLQDGYLEFDPMPILRNYMTNDSYNNEIGVYGVRRSFMYYHITVARTYAGVSEAIIWRTENKFDNGPYIFDGALDCSSFEYASGRYRALLSQKLPAPSQIGLVMLGAKAYRNGDVVDLSKTTIKCRKQATAGAKIYTLAEVSTAARCTVDDVSSYRTYDGDYDIISITEDDNNFYVTVNTTYRKSSCIGMMSLHVECAVNRSMSNASTNLQLTENDYYSADFIRFQPSYEGDKISNIVVEMQYKTGGWQWFNAALTTPPYFENTIFTLGIGPKNIKNTLEFKSQWGTMSGQEVWDYAPFDRYRVWVGENVYPYRMFSKPFVVDVCKGGTVKNVHGYDRIWLVYKSKWGGWSWLSFNYKMKKDQEVKQTTYNRRRLSTDGYQARGASVIANSVKQSYTLNSPLVNESEWTFYEDLFSSPQVYMYMPETNGVTNTWKNFIPMVVNSKQTQLYSPNNDKVFYYTIEVSEANSINKQLR